MNRALTVAVCVALAASALALSDIPDVKWYGIEEAVARSLESGKTMMFVVLGENDESSKRLLDLISSSAAVRRASQNFEVSVVWHSQTEGMALFSAEDNYVPRVHFVTPSLRRLNVVGPQPQFKYFMVDQATLLAATSQALVERAKFASDKAIVLPVKETAIVTQCDAPAGNAIVMDGGVGLLREMREMNADLKRTMEISQQRMTTDLLHKTSELVAAERAQQEEESKRKLAEARITELESNSRRERQHLSDLKAQCDGMAGRVSETTKMREELNAERRLRSIEVDKMRKLADDYTVLKSQFTTLQLSATTDRAKVEVLEKQLGSAADGEACATTLTKSNEDAKRWKRAVSDAEKRAETAQKARSQSEQRVVVLQKELAAAQQQLAVEKEAVAEASKEAATGTVKALEAKHEAERKRWVDNAKEWQKQSKGLQVELTEAKASVQQLTAANAALQKTVAERTAQLQQSGSAGGDAREKAAKDAHEADRKRWVQNAEAWQKTVRGLEDQLKASKETVQKQNDAVDVLMKGKKHAETNAGNNFKIAEKNKQLVEEVQGKLLKAQQAYAKLSEEKSDLEEQLLAAQVVIRENYEKAASATGASRPPAQPAKTVDDSANDAIKAVRDRLNKK